MGLSIPKKKNKNIYIKLSNVSARRGIKYSYIAGSY